MKPDRWLFRALWATALIVGSGWMACSWLSVAQAEPLADSLATLLMVSDDSRNGITYEEAMRSGTSNTPQDRRMLIDAYYDSRVNIHYQIAYVLSWKPDSDAEAVYLDALGMGDLFYRKSVIRALGTIRSAAARGPLSAIMDRTNDWIEYYTCLQALRAIRGETKPAFDELLQDLWSAPFSDPQGVRTFDPATAELIQSNAEYFIPGLLDIYYRGPSKWTREATASLYHFIETMVAGQEEIAIPYIRRMLRKNDHDLYSIVNGIENGFDTDVKVALESELQVVAVTCSYHPLREQVRRILKSIGRPPTGDLTSLPRLPRPRFTIKWPGDVRESISAVACSPDGNWLVGAHWPDGRISMWRPRDARMVWQNFWSHQWVNCLAFSPEGRLLATGGGPRTIVLWRTETGEQVREWQVVATDNGYIERISFSPSGGRLACGVRFNQAGFWRQQVLIWDIVTGELLFSLEPYRLPILISDQTILLVGPPTTQPDGSGDRAALYLYDLQRNDSAPFPGSDMSNVMMNAYADSTGIVAVSFWGGIRQWDVSRPETPVIITDGLGDVRSLIYSPDGEKLLALTEHRDLWIVDSNLRTSSRLWPDRSISSLNFSPDGSRLFIGSTGVEVWDPTASDLRVVFQTRPTGCGGPMEWIAYTLDGYYQRSDNGCDFLEWQWENDSDRHSLGTLPPGYRRPDLVRKAYGE